MKLTAIRASDLKGQDLAATLTGADVFVGPNGSGKTTHLLAVLAGLRGLATVPTDAVREYIGPKPVVGVVELDFGAETLIRDLSQTKGRAVAAADALASRIAGPHLVRWDLADFATATDSSRAKLLEQVCSVSGSAGKWTAQRIALFLCADPATTRASPWTELLVAHPLDVDGAGDLDAGRWVTQAIAWAAATYTDTNAAAKTARATVEGMAEERARAPKDGGDLAAARARVTELEAEATAARSALDQARAVGHGRDNHIADGDRLAALVSDYAADVEAQRGALDEARTGVAAAEAAAQAATEQKDRTRAAVAVTAEVVANSTALDDSASKAWEAKDRAAGRARDELATLQALAGQAGACKHCSAADPLGLDGRIRAVEETLSDAQADAIIARGVARRINEGLGAAHGEAGRARAADMAADYDGRVAANVLAAARSVLTQAEKDLPRAEAAHTRAAADLAAWALRPTPPAPVDTGEAQARLDAATAVLVEAKRAHEALVRQQEREAAYQRAVATREEADAKLAAVRLLGTALRRLQSEIAADAYGPITAEANVLLTEAGSDLRVEFHDEADYGARKGDAFVHFAALSDAERATVGASLCYAFARLTKAPWRAVILDRLEVVDDTRLPGLMTALVAAVVEERIDNFLGACVGEADGYGAAHGVTVHRLGLRPALALVSQ